MDAMREAEEATGKFDGFRLNIAVAYGGREEISDSVRFDCDGLWWSVGVR